MLVALAHLPLQSCYFLLFGLGLRLVSKDILFQAVALRSRVLQVCFEAYDLRLRLLEAAQNFLTPASVLSLQILRFDGDLVLEPLYISVAILERLVDFAFVALPEPRAFECV